HPRGDRFHPPGGGLRGQRDRSPRHLSRFAAGAGEVPRQARLSVPLISDERHQMLEAYGAWGEKSMYGRTFLGIIRSTILVGPDGRVAKIWRNVKVDGHAEEVLAAAQAL